MSLHHVLLSLLREPMSGTDLIQMFRGTINHFWSTDLSQIYKALDALERDGCVTAQRVPSARGPARKVYGLTRAGKDRLGAWVRRGPKVPPTKFEFLAQLFSVTADAEPALRARELLQELRREAAEAVAVLEKIDATAATLEGYPDALPGELFYPWLTLRHGLLRRRALLEWIDESLARLDRRPAEADAGMNPDGLTDLVTALHLVEEADDGSGPEPANEK